MASIKKQKRATQQRALDTRQVLLDTAISLFSTMGYEGTSIRMIETEAGLKRGIGTYHFGTKEDLWKASIQALFAKMPMPDDDDKALDALSAEAKFRYHITRFIEGSARNPEVSRVIIQEGRRKSWRLDYLLENFVSPRINMLKSGAGKELDAHSVYILIGAATLVFDVAAECESLFGVHPDDEKFIAEHAKRVCDLLLGQAPSFLQAT